MGILLLILIIGGGFFGLLFLGVAHIQARQGRLRKEAYHLLDGGLADKNACRSLAQQLGAFRDSESQELVRRLMA